MLGLLVTGLAMTPLTAVGEEESILPEETWMSFAATPFLYPRGMAQALSGIKESMEFVLKTRIRFATNLDTDGFRERLQQANDDLILLFSDDYPLAQSRGYIALAQFASPLRAFIVVPVSSELQTMNGLRNRTLMYPAHGSPIAGLARQAVTAAGIDWKRDIYTRALRTDGACLHELLLGRGDACAAFQAPTRIVQQQMSVKLRAIGESSSLPPLLFAAHQRVPFETREKVRKGLISLDDTGSGRARLRTAGISRIVEFEGRPDPAPSPPTDQH